MKESSVFLVMNNIKSELGYTGDGNKKSKCREFLLFESPKKGLNLNLKNSMANKLKKLLSRPISLTFILA